MTARGHRSIDHTADLALEIWGESEVGVLEQAAVALAELLMDGAEVAMAERRTVSIDALDREDRLVRWLSELLWLATGDGFVVARAAVALRDDGGLSAEVDGAVLAVAQEIKAATYHDVRLAPDGDGWRARIVFDV